MNPTRKILLTEAVNYPHLTFLPCLDSPEMAETCLRELDIPRFKASALGQSAVEAAEKGFYVNETGKKVDWSALVSAAISAKRYIPPESNLPEPALVLFPETRVQVTNETTLKAARRLTESGLEPLALNFANGVHPGGGFLGGARAHEETLCRSSALYHTLEGDPMYAAHAKRPTSDSSGWAILSPGVPVFRTDGGRPLEKSWLCSFITCAAPYAPTVGQPASRILLKQCISRVLAIALANRYTSLVLGDWGCGAFRNDTDSTALDFREALENDSRGDLSDLVFAITDWSPERKFLKPFCNHFSQPVEKDNTPG